MKFRINKFRIFRKIWHFFLENWKKIRFQVGKFGKFRREKTKENKRKQKKQEKTRENKRKSKKTKITKEHKRKQKKTKENKRERKKERKKERKNERKLVLHVLCFNPTQNRKKKKER